MSDLETSFIEERNYQKNLLTILQNINNSYSIKPPVLIELDCGMGKRIISYLLTKKYFPEKKTLIILQATSSLEETADFFINKYKVEIGVLSSRISSKFRISILKENNLILTTPQTLANTIEHLNKNDLNIEIILINEIDKIIRRTATRRTLIFPYNKLLEYFSSSWFIGLSGTLRDSHIIISDKIRIVEELQTLADNFPNVRIISMDEIIAGDENYSSYIKKTKLKVYPIKDLEIEMLFKKLDELIKTIRRSIIKIAIEEGLINENQKNLAIIAGQLPVDSEIVGRYNSLLMIRKYITGMLPFKWKYFLQKFPEFTKEYVDSLSNNSSKIGSLRKIIDTELTGNETKKVIVMVSYILTGETIKKFFQKSNYETFMISGRTFEKSKVINEFKSSKNNAILIMTMVGERDLDIPESKLIIVFDSINTLKTMYQRFKRTRGGTVVCLCYAETSEQQKIKRIFDGIKEKYPWSLDY
jgi:ERCC4-related helicase